MNGVHRQHDSDTTRETSPSSPHPYSEGLGSSQLGMGMEMDRERFYRYVGRRLLYVPLSTGLYEFDLCANQ